MEEAKEFVLGGYAMPMEAIAIFSTGFLAFVAALFGISDQRRVVRQRTTFEHYARIAADRDMIAAKATYIKLTETPGAMAACAKNLETEDTQALTRVLNNLELMSIGIQMNIVDFELVKRFNRSAIIKYWEHTAQFVLEMRRETGNRFYYHEFEEMARWMRDDQMPQRIRGDHFWMRRRGWLIGIGVAVFSFVLGAWIF